MFTTMAVLQQRLADPACEYLYHEDAQAQNQWMIFTSDPKRWPTR
jgi:hypothetical protein